MKRRWGRGAAVTASLFAMLALIWTAGPGPAAAYADDGGITVKINGAAEAMDQAPLLMNGIAFVPVRPVVEALGASVAWSDHSRTVTVTKDGQSARLPVGSKEAYIADRPQELESEVRLVGNTAMVPARFFNEVFGMYVSWDAGTQTVSIDADEPFYGRTKRQIVSRMMAAVPQFSGDPFEDKPQIVSPHQAGKLNTDFIEDGVRTVNTMRYLAGVPDDLAQDSFLNEQAQYGAVLLAVYGQLSHTPAKPKGMSESFYSKGYASTSSSNIYSLYGAAGAVKQNAILPRTVVSYMSDNDESNVASVGHRRWILNPDLKKIGFGLAEGRASNGYRSFYSSMQVLDQSRADKFDYDIISWPGKGYFPLKYFQGNDPWSVTLNPDKYATPDPNEVSVSLTRLNDQEIWTMDKDDDAAGEGKAYFNVNTHKYGVPNCIVFRPGGNMRYEDGDRFEVQISGLKDAEGHEARVVYQVVFFAY
ncbi:hypothetical protein SK3146_05863 [Paenibacillus konkukensis]|uniref:Copper amine oxidase-like N-terminal domain-containing protein n=2 Tax=Paenibacillus konkukensis TaxID=2020716 RepID=A0ABY4RXR0_9BACL|nr:hypothetical protein SK3146_05863 [Paenibacillus konkukensis]